MMEAYQGQGRARPVISASFSSNGLGVEGAIMLERGTILTILCGAFAMRGCGAFVTRGAGGSPVVLKLPFSTLGGGPVRLIILVVSATDAVFVV